MSIRIQNDGLTGAMAPETSRTQDVVQIGNLSTGLSSRIGSASDNVEISSLSGNIADASSALATAQASRLRQLTQLYQSGRYQVDTSAVSRALVANALQSGGIEG